MLPQPGTVRMVPLRIIKPNRLPRNHLPLPPLIPPHPVQSYFLQQSSLAPPPQMGDVLNDFRVAARGLAVIGRRGQGTAALEPRAFQTHPFHLPLLRFGELGRDNDQAEVYHEKRTDLQRKLISVCGRRSEAAVGALLIRETFRGKMTAIFLAFL